MSLDRASSGGETHAAVPVIWSVIVTYHPEVRHVARCVAQLREGGIEVVIVDNASNSTVVAALRQIAASHGASLIALAENSGIGAAQNAGIRKALQAKANFVLLLDHDSLPDTEMVRFLVAAYAEGSRDNRKVAAVGPVSVDSRTGSRGFFVRLSGIRIRRIKCDPGVRVVHADFLIASGMLIAARVFDDVGLMSEDLFIDHVDTEWCMRARSMGYAILGVCNAQLKHTLGDSVIRFWLGRWREVSVHSPMRHYYVFRNTVLMLRRTPMPAAWKAGQLIRLAQFFAFYTLFAGDRVLRVRFMIRGILDGLRNRTGVLHV